ATLTAVTLIAFKFAWRKIFAVLAVGRRAEEMASTFQLGTLFDHYCAKLHVGAGIDRAQATQLRAVIPATLAETERGALVTAVRDGAGVLGRSVLEAPSWANAQVERAARRWAESGGTTTDPLEGADEPTAPNNDGVAASGNKSEARWLDRAARVVEERLG